MNVENKKSSKEISEKLYSADCWAKPQYAVSKNKIKRKFFNFLDRRKRIIFSFLPFKKNLRILDWGCGCGYLTIPLAKEYEKYNLEIHGCDISAIAINKLKKYCNDNNINNISLKVSEEWKLPYPDDYFDAIVSSDVLGHVSEPRKSLSELYRVLKKDGILSLHTESIHFLDRFYYKKIFNYLSYNPWGEEIGHINLKKHEEIVEDIKFSRFKLQKIISAPQYLGFILNGDICWGLRKLDNNAPADLKLIKKWHEALEKQKYLRLLANLFLVMEEEIEFRLTKNFGGSIYFKLNK